MAFAEVVEVGVVDARAVKKHVVVAGAAAGRNEAETLVSDSFDCALFHSSNPILFKKSCVRRVRVKRSCKPSVTVVVICAASESDGSTSSDVFVSAPNYPRQASSQSAPGPLLELLRWAYPEVILIQSPFAHCGDFASLRPCVSVPFRELAWRTYFGF